MSNPSIQPLEKRSGASIERKLLFMLLIVAILPITLLAATIGTGMFQFEAIIASVVAQVLGLTIGYYFVSGIVRQSASISETLVSINNGDFEARAESVTKDELGEVAVALNAMCDNTLNLIQSNNEQDCIQTSIETLISEMQEIAAGDLTITTAVHDDMTGSIAASVNDMTEQLRSIVQQVQLAAKQVTTSSTRIRAASTVMSNDTDAQAHRIHEASEQLLEMTGSFQKVAALTEESVQVAVEARQSASNGLKAVSDTVDGMQRIRNQVQSTSKRIKRFGESSQEIGEIVQMISDITDRTSILALNASIQAAIAGDAGQGFAVVAEEIERLAESSKDATKQISKLVRTIQNETSEVIVDMEESTREVVAGSQLASQAGETLFEIDSVSNQLVELIQSSSTFALEQADTATKVASTMSEISMSTKESAETSREATRSVGRLADRVSRLRDSVSQFKISSDLDMSEYLDISPNDSDVRDENTFKNKSADAGNLVISTPQETSPESTGKNKRQKKKADRKKNVPQHDYQQPVPQDEKSVPQTMFIEEQDLVPSAADVEAESKAIDDNLLSNAREAREMLKKIKTADIDEVSLESQENQTAPEPQVRVSETMIFDQDELESAPRAGRTVCQSIDSDMLQELKGARELLEETRKASKSTSSKQDKKKRKNTGTVNLDDK